MLDVSRFLPTAPHTTTDPRGCEGYRRLPRRSMLQVGSLGALGLCLGDFLRLRAAAGEGDKTAAFTAQSAKGKLPERINSVIQLNLGGGFPQHESFDPKPEAPLEYRGPFGVVKTKTGEIFSDNFPRTADIADKRWSMATVTTPLALASAISRATFTRETPRMAAISACVRSAT